MRKILEDLYFGNITPTERQMAPNSGLRRAVDRAVRCEKRLRAQLNETEQRLLCELVSVQHDIDSITACENFILGFRLGVRMMVECMDEGDGDTQMIEEEPNEAECQASVSPCKTWSDGCGSQPQETVDPAVSSGKTPV